MNERRDQGIDGRQDNHPVGDGSCAVGTGLVGNEDDPAASRSRFFNVGHRLVEEFIARRNDNDRNMLVYQRDRPVFHLSRGMGLRVNVADFLELQRSLHGNDGGRATAKVENMARFGDVPGNLPELFLHGDDAGQR